MWFSVVEVHDKYDIIPGRTRKNVASRGVFGDSTENSDLVDRAYLLIILRRIGCQQLFRNINSFCNDLNGSVRCNESLSGTLTIMGRGIKDMS